MIDMETYGISPKSVFRTIAAVLFSFKYEVPTSHILIDCGVSIEEQLLYGSEIDQSTVNFWRDQPEELRDVLYSKQQEPLRVVLLNLRDNIREHIDKDTTIYLWSHGSNFDTVILDQAYKALGIKPFWDFRNVRDTRTLFDLAGYEYKARGGHDALEDAVNQVAAVRNAFKDLVKGGINGGKNG